LRGMRIGIPDSGIDLRRGQVASRM